MNFWPCPCLITWRKRVRPVAGKINEELDQILQSVVRIELLTFFQANPHTRDTADGLALRLHRPRHQVEMALNALSALGILEMSSRRVTIYRLRNSDLITSYLQEQAGKDVSGPTCRQDWTFG
ncbi:hypothetical protein PTH_0751 [Pelotomaculum thermopropionicum SI]|uniref:Uncharacterized protein n=1 Tax=Pelotomaculum thermopropionicum (strain DSM 13744 / JCM 10971 / SI) TaxID=370438 RepID=A5D491_PELTS|nr:hypothetical protein PTH_0751 [Pelotomaculum thermopropionicum SI]